MTDRRRSTWLDRLAWVAAGLLACWSLLWVFAGGWLFFDVALSFQAQVLGLGLMVLVVLLVGRRWRAASVAGVACVVGAWPLAAGRAIVRPPVDLVSVPAEGTIRLVTFNIDPENQEWRDDLEVVFSWSPDVVVLIETSPDFWRSVVRRGELADTDWSRYIRRLWVDEFASPCYVLSRWPIEKMSFEEIANADRDVCIAEITHPDGLFRVGAIHPHSPRTLWRWQQGNRQMRTTGEALGAVLGGETPLLAGVDLNSGPAGARAGWLRGWGLSMSKPVLGGWGSFPSGTIGPLRVQLDDVWHSDGIEIIAWSSPGGFSSDHRPVVVDVRLDR